MESNVSAAVFMLNEIDMTKDIIEELEQVKQIGEIILVTPYKEAVQRFSGYQKLRIILEEKREGKSNAVQKAIDSTDKKYMLHVTGDSRIKAAEIERLIDTATLSGSGAVVSLVKILNTRHSIMGKVDALLWEIYNETNRFLNTINKAKSGDVFIFERGLVRTIPGSLINDDAYIDSVINGQSAGITQSAAVISITGPYTPRDYITQRSRIAQGHFQLIFKHGITPNSLVFSSHIPFSMRVRIFIKAVRTDKAYVPMTPVFLFLEGVSVLLGLKNLSKQTNIWAQIKK